MVAHGVSLRRCVEILPSSGSVFALACFRQPLASVETLLAAVAPSTRAEWFCHRHQTDQLMVLRGGIAPVMAASDGRDHLPRPLPGVPDSLALD